MTQTMSAYSSATRALTQEYKSMMEDPVEGFRVKLMTDDLFNWEVAIFGPPDTPYQGGYFKAHMKFPKDYPYAPPSLRFLSKVWHPNVYENGDLCISILHPPVADPQSGEDPSERWNPTQNVRTILLSVISLLNEPNTSSPANVDASVMYRRWKESNGADKEYENIIRHQVNATKGDAERDNVVVPLTQEEWCMRGKQNPLSGTSFDSSGGTGSAHSTFFLDHVDIYTDDGYDEDDDDDEPITTEEEDEDTPPTTEPEIGTGTDEPHHEVTTTTGATGANPRRRRPIIIPSSTITSQVIRNPPNTNTTNPAHSSTSSHYI